MSSSITHEEKWAVFNALRLFNDLKTRGVETESLEVAINCISTAFDMEVTDLTHINMYSCEPKTLDSYYEEPIGLSTTAPTSVEEDLYAEVKAHPKFAVFLESVKNRGMFDGLPEGGEEYNNRMEKVILKFKQKFVTETAPATAAAAAPTDVGAETRADEYKAKGNDALVKKDLHTALDMYSKAIEISPMGSNSHLYYSNRAAVYCQMNELEKACADAEKAVAAQPNFAKGHARLGYAHFELGRYEEAVSAYRAALGIDPSNESWQTSLRQAIDKNKQEASSSVGTGVPSIPTMGGGGMPDFGSLMSDPAMMNAAASMMGGAGGAGGGMPNMASMMQNPAMMQMAQQVMQNPAMMQSMMSMMGGGGGAGDAGGMDMGALASMMGGAGGAGGMDMGALASMMGGGGGMPSMSAPAATSAPVATPVTDAAPGGIDSEMLSRISSSPAFQSLRSDPEMAMFFADLELEGPSAAIRHMSNPAIMAKVSEAMAGSM